jgi:DNA-binding SARP family transcriptional activator
MDIDVLGTLRLDAGSVTLAPRERMVLTALAVRVGSVLTIDELADVLWGDAPPVSAPKVVQGCIAR